MNRPFVFLLLLSFPFLAFAQPSDSSHAVRQNAIFFSFSGLNPGGGFGIRLSQGDKRFARIEIAGSVESAKTNRSLTAPSMYNSASKDLWVSLNVALATRMMEAGELYPYAGPTLGGHWRVWQSEQAYKDKMEHFSFIERRFTLGAFLGVEYRLTSQISLSVEHLLQAMYGSEEGVRYWQFGHSTSTLHLVLYLW